MSEENVEIVRRVYEAFAQRDSLTPFEVHAPDIEWDVSAIHIEGMAAAYHGTIESVPRSGTSWRCFANLSFNPSS